MMILDTIAPNLTRVESGRLRVWFSYSTAVAMQHGDEAPLVAQNEWNNATGRHLNKVDGGTPAAKAKRVPWVEFIAHLDEATGGRPAALALA